MALQPMMLLPCVNMRKVRLNTSLIQQILVMGIWERNKTIC
nr:MAG TPA: hypothetical protein [Caudoviricetes sp.]